MTKLPTLQIYPAALKLADLLGNNDLACVDENWIYEPAPEDLKELALEDLIGQIAISNAEFHRMKKEWDAVPMNDDRERSLEREKDAVDDELTRLWTDVERRMNKAGWRYSTN